MRKLLNYYFPEKVGYLAYLLAVLLIVIEAFWFPTIYMIIPISLLLCVYVRSE